jgi:maltodextrin utilization protein YvdJ
MENEQRLESVKDEKQEQKLEVEIKDKKSVIVGRVWIDENQNVISGYVVVSPGVTIKFAGNLDNNPTFLYLSKKR